MVETLAAGVQYIAILVLCLSCWAAGRSVRLSPPQAKTVRGRRIFPDLPLIVRESSEQQLRNRTFAYNRSRQLSGAVAGGSNGDHSYHDGTDNLRQAFAVRDLITTGDLSQEGVLEALVAMAEEQEEAAAQRNLAYPRTRNSQVLPVRRAAPVTWRSNSANGAPPPALAEEAVVLASDADTWLGPDRRVQRTTVCASPRILTRVDSVEEPIPAAADNPVSPEVLARYRSYAQEYASSLEES